MNYGTTGGTLAATGALGFFGMWYVGVGVIILVLLVLITRHFRGRIK